MNLRKFQPASDNDKVVNLCLDKHLKHWPENVRRKRTAQLRLKSLDNNPGWCIKKSLMGRVEVAKPLDDNDRKMLFSVAAMDSSLELQGFSRGVRLKKINEGSCKKNRVQCPNASTLLKDSIIKAVNPSVKKYPKHLRMGGASCLNEDLIKFVKWPESIRKKRSSSGLSQGSVRPGKRQEGARQKFQTFYTHSLPEEVVEEILSRLPVKSLARFRCVCKSWHHLSYSRRFISLHLKNYRTSQFLVGTCQAFSSNCSMYFLPPPPPKGGYCDKDRASQEMVKHKFPNLFGGSCNGIVCMYAEYGDGDIVLWNPATNESKRIRGLCQIGLRGYCTVGFGFDPMTNDYKILRMLYSNQVDQPFKPPVAHLALYSLRKGSWKIVDSHDFLVVRNHTPVDIACSLPFTNNRIVCAVVSPINGESKWEIILFDMSSEMYEVIPVPPSLDAELGDHKSGLVAHTYRNRYFKLFPFKETIALGIVHRKGSYCDVWVLNDFSSTHRHQSRSWSKFFSTDMNDCHTVPVGCWGRSQIIFQEILSKRLFHLNLGNNMMMMELGVIPPDCVFTTLYKESLVPINDTKEAQDSGNGKPYH